MITTHLTTRTPAKGSYLSKGFTLTELMITLVVVAILTTIAIPSYRQYVIRSYLTESFDTLSAFYLRMEQSYQDTGNYGANNVCNIAPTNTPHFNYACTLANNGQSFTITATGNGTQGVTGYVYTLNNIGARTTTAYPNGAVPATCWLSRAGGC